MRLFIAFDVSKEAKEHILEVQKQLTDAKLTLTKSFHLTLKFLGEVTPAKAEEIKNKLKTVQFKPFKAHLNGTGVFPNENYVRVVWIGIEPADVICELQKKIDDALGSKEKDFKPHITLARVKFSDKQFAEKIKKLKVEPVSFEVKEFKLIESKLESEGPEYTDVAKYPAKSL
ncbi:RNA 2',3'-cyclic phosphodiesterase [uncultured archaeon]|nr:RNA 2',3'-cyclic phosphodiesterase [uncultured archaeon]